MNKKTDQEYDEKEAQQRFEAALRGGLKTPATPLKERRGPEGPRLASKKKAQNSGKRPKAPR
jgi:hypothetical protein